MPELVFSGEAEKDLSEAYAWYEAQRTGLGEEFLNSIEARLDSIMRVPEGCTVVYSTFRRGLVRRFPYAIFYDYNAGIVTVYAVFHTAQDPAKWRRRLP